MTHAHNWPYPRFIAHRGGGAFAPENTLAAFRVGASFGYRMFECDIKLSRDDVLFALHDDTLDRTSNIKEADMATTEGVSFIAGNLTWGALSRLDAGTWFSRQFSGEPIATMDAIVQFCLHNHYAVNIEIKPTDSAVPAEDDALAYRTGEAIARRIQKLWTSASPLPLLSSFKPQALIAAQAAAPELPRGLLLDDLWSGWLDCATRLDCVIVTCNSKLWNADSVAAVKAQGMRLGSYTINDAQEAKRLLGLGIDCIYTDRLDLFSPASQ